MIGLDTNVIVRYIAQDDPAQSLQAAQLIESLTPDAPGYLPLVVVVEMGWVLLESYGVSREELAAVLDTLLRTKTLVLEQAETVFKATRLFASGNADFADCLIACSGKAARCDYTATFDKKAAKALGMRLVGEIRH